MGPALNQIKDQLQGKAQIDNRGILTNYQICLAMSIIVAQSLIGKREESVAFLPSVHKHRDIFLASFEQSLLADQEQGDSYPI